MFALTVRREDYLKAIYKLQREQRVVRVKDLAHAMGVSAPTVVGILNGLKEQGLVSQEPYGYLELSKEGVEEAQRLLERERLVRDFFRDILGLPEDEAELNACAVEHYITPACLDRFVAFVRFLKVCHHGRPRWLEHYDSFAQDGELPAEKEEKCDSCDLCSPL